MKLPENICSIRARVARESHPDCAVCGEQDLLGLGLRFKEGEDGSLLVSFSGGSPLRGYPDRLHGGIVATLFDAAMTHCLFARGLTGVTAKLNIRFLAPVAPDRPVIVRTRVTRQKFRLYLLDGMLEQEGELKCTAEAGFWSIPQADGRGG